MGVTYILQQTMGNLLAMDPVGRLVNPYGVQHGLATCRTLRTKKEERKKEKLQIKHASLKRLTTDYGNKCPHEKIADISQHQVLEHVGKDHSHIVQLEEV